MIPFQSSKRWGSPNLWPKWLVKRFYTLLQKKSQFMEVVFILGKVYIYFGDRKLQRMTAYRQLACRINQRHQNAGVKSFPMVYDMPIQTPYDAYILHVIYRWKGLNLTVAVIACRIIQREACHAKFAKVSCTLLQYVVCLQVEGLDVNQALNFVCGFLGYSGGRQHDLGRLLK